MRQDEIEKCYTYEPGAECMGTGGRKLRQVCVYCPNYRKHKERTKSERKEAKEHEKGN